MTLPLKKSNKRKKKRETNIENEKSTSASPRDRNGAKIASKKKERKKKRGLKNKQCTLRCQEGSRDDIFSNSLTQFIDDL